MKCNKDRNVIIKGDLAGEHEEDPEGEHNLATLPSIFGRLNNHKESLSLRPIIGQAQPIL